MADLYLVVAKCGRCDGHLKGWHYDYKPAESGEYVHMTHGPNDPNQHEPELAADTAKLTAHNVWHVLPAMGW